MFVVTKKLFKEKEAVITCGPGCCFAENPFCGNSKLGRQRGVSQPRSGEEGGGGFEAWAFAIGWFCSFSITHC